MTISKRILLGVTGGIAVYKSAELVRLLRKQGYEVRVVMTQSAIQFVSPLTFQALSGYAVHTELLDTDTENAMSHIALARWADLLLIAPATANTIAKLAHGLADDLLATLYLAVQCPVYIAPAMNQAMWHKAITQQNVKQLQAQGVNVIGPAVGEQACGDIGLGRMSEPEAICQQVGTRFMPSCLQGVKVLISAGPTREALDPVRYMTNRSSGKMGYAIAKAAVQAGATVILVSGPVNLSLPEAVECYKVESAQQMYDVVIKKARECDIYIGAAAVADYRPQLVQNQKIKKQASEIMLVLEKTQDILAAVAQLAQRPFTIGFAAETNNLADYAKTKLQEKNLDMIAANWVGREQGGFDSEQNALQVFWKKGEKTLAMMNKTQLAEQFILLCAEIFHEKSTV